MIGIRTDNKAFRKALKNIIMYYKYTDISISVKNAELSEDGVVKMDVDSIKLFHATGGDITSLYSHNRNDCDNVIYVNDSDELLDELRRIMNFIDGLNEFVFFSTRGKEVIE